MNYPHLNIDFYKAGHRDQYPKGIKKVFSNWTPRYSVDKSTDGMRFFGLQYYIMEHLIDQWQEYFFMRQKVNVIREYRELMSKAIGISDTSHIEELHDFGNLPLKIWALPEGHKVPYGVPTMVITNTRPEFFWLPNYIESNLSNVLWMPSTSATTARGYREMFEKAAREFGEYDMSFVDNQGHDFSYRGLPGTEAAILSGMGHLTSFSGTDTVMAIVAARKYYGADWTVGGSVPATEHSVMCAGGKDGEIETFRRLIQEVYPKGVVSIVSDTWNLWTVLTEYIPRLKSLILGREGKIVIRPDSGDPVKILCGDPDSTFGPERAGVLRLLADALGVNDRGLINSAGAIYGDSITPTRAQQILDRTVRELKLHPYNLVLGIGSYTYQYKTRDNHGQAMKMTATIDQDGFHAIFKDPITDKSGKKSHRGIPVVYSGDLAFGDQTDYFCIESNDPADLDRCAFRPVFEDGMILQVDTFDEIRKRMRA